MIEIKDLVSNAKVLDVFLQDNEKPEVIINHILLNLEYVGELFNRSVCWPKIFSYSFVKRCSYDEIDKLISLIDGIFNLLDICNTATNNNYVAAISMMYCCWQCIDRRSDLSAFLKSKFRKTLMKGQLLFSRSLSSNINHPYRANGCCNTYIETIDNELFNAISNGISIGEALANLDYVKFGDMFEFLIESIFIFDILQYDVFASLPMTHKWIVLCKICNTAKSTFIDSTSTTDEYLIASMLINNLLIQILDSDEDDVLKIEAMHKSENKALSGALKNKNYDTFSEMIFNSAISGEMLDEAKLRKLILKKIRSKDLDFLKEWIDYDKEWFNSIICMSNAIERYLKKENANE